jgi:hypothetical protein
MKLCLTNSWLGDVGKFKTKMVASLIIDKDGIYINKKRIFTLIRIKILSK